MTKKEKLAIEWVDKADMLPNSQWPKREAFIAGFEAAKAELLKEITVLPLSSLIKRIIALGNEEALYDR